MSEKPKLVTREDYVESMKAVLRNQVMYYESDIQESAEIIVDHAIVNKWITVEEVAP